MTDGTFGAFETGRDGVTTGSEGEGAGNGFWCGERLEDESGRGWRGTESAGSIVIGVSGLRRVGGAEEELGKLVATGAGGDGRLK